MPKVGIIMGSDSDLKVMSKAGVMLEELGIEYEMTIISAHREPDELIEWTRSRRPWNQGYDRRCRNGSSPSGNVCSIICPSGYWCTSFRKESGWNGCSVLNHADAPGVPVATVAIDGARKIEHFCSKDSCSFR